MKMVWKLSSSQHRFEPILSRRGDNYGVENRAVIPQGFSSFKNLCLKFEDLIVYKQSVRLLKVREEDKFAL